MHLADTSAMGKWVSRFAQRKLRRWARESLVTVLSMVDLRRQNICSKSTALTRSKGPYVHSNLIINSKLLDVRTL